MMEEESPPRYSQSSSRRSSRLKGERGTGLGLCLCSSPGATRFDLQVASVPRADSGVVRSGTSPVRLAGYPPACPVAQADEDLRLRVLIVDDDPDVLRPLCDYLSRSGLIVQAATSAGEAIELYQAAQPDIVVSDIAMPGMDGIELCSILRKAHPGLVVVLMSGQASDIEITRLRDLGATALLPKPFTMRQMLELLQSVSRRSAGRLFLLAPEGLSRVLAERDYATQPRKVPPYST